MGNFLRVKEWNEYTKDEKESLLLHWWYYFGESFRTIEEYETFHELVNKEPDAIFKLAISGYIRGNNVEDLLKAIREKNIGELITKVGIKSKDEKYKKIFESSANALIDDIVTTYNDPEPDSYMDDEDIKNEINNILKLKSEKKEFNRLS